MGTVKPRVDVREAALVEARAIIEESGLEALSLREVARRLGISHQAPYKHYPSRDHLLAEVIARCYADFAAYLDDSTKGEMPPDALRNMGRAYMRYALESPLSYRLMFGAQMPDPAQHPEMLAKAQHAFQLLRSALEALPRPGRTASMLEADAMFIWSTIHGLASILHTRAIDSLQLTDESVEALIDSTLNKIGMALGLQPS
ncbi:TetR/AcrR family transcriptional regulator [Aquidulcibacter sp.]|uniref:TetR/AcrR family transcriptional regulator n=1 Tax=Aquidulcibacter sp. TaxID=2052990 RepID=UPI0025C2778D|nr:TetR/AcrR family transcriptional regulator [Aquidulcibacter sp.]MCA3693019.1 TetR/AcrR family transcriptional regulator [Aquidulcibacter sp.]